LEVLRSDGLPDINAMTIVETNESGSEKDPRGSASFAVVTNEVRLVGALGAVTNGNRFEQVLVASPDAEPSNRHHIVGACTLHNCRGQATVYLECQTCETPFKSEGRDKERHAKRRAGSTRMEK
jgi:hypothetical protein